MEKIKMIPKPTKAEIERELLPKDPYLVPGGDYMPTIEELREVKE